MTEKIIYDVLTTAAWERTSYIIWNGQLYIKYTMYIYWTAKEMSS